MSHDPAQQPPVQQHPHQQYPTQQQPYPGQPNQPYPGQPQAPAPRKSFFARHKILTAFLALLALVVVISVATSGGGGAPEAGTADVPAVDSGAAPEAPADAPAEEAPAAAGIGTPVRDGKFEFTVTSVEPGVASVGDEYLSVDAQGQFVLVHVTVTNIGDAAQMFTASTQKLVDDQGREHSADSTAGIYLGDANSFLNDINPGNSIQGVVIFDVPADAVPASITLHDSFMSGGTTVALG